MWLVASLGSLPLINLASSSEVIKLLGLWLSRQDKQAEVEDREEWEGESCRLWAYQTHPSGKRGVSEVHKDDTKKAVLFSEAWLCVAERDAVMCVFYWVAESSFSPCDFFDLLSSFLPWCVFKLQPASDKSHFSTDWRRTSKKKKKGRSRKEKHWMGVSTQANVRLSAFKQK